MNTCKIIAEIGINHNGDMDLAKKLILVAKQSGADYVKFQTYHTDSLVSKESPQYELLKNHELSKSQFKYLFEYADSLDIVFISTPFDCDSVDILEYLQVPLYKIGSGDLNNYLLLNKVKQTNKPIILSTGMSDLKDIQDSLDFLKDSDITLMHCTSAYPTPIDNINMSCLELLKQFNCKIGLSDHSVLIEEIAYMAIAFNISFIEKHLTLNKNMIGPDHNASLDPFEFSKFVKSIKTAQIIYGIKNKTCQDIEKQTKNITQRYIYTKYDIDKDTIITFDNIIVLRSNHGINVKDINRVLNKKVNKKLYANSLLSLEDLGEM